jgi:hypothetical protein
MAIEEVVIELMTKDFILWRCLHGGPLTNDSINQWEPGDRMPWVDFRIRNVPLLESITDAYGACAVVARIGDQIVGILRFYPKVIAALTSAGGLCLQQEYPAGPTADFYSTDFISLRISAEKTLVVHCMMTGSPSQKENPYQRKGIGKQLVRKLIEWSQQNGWEAIEATAYEDLDIIYAITGQAGKSFWEKLGFRIVEVGKEPAFEELGIVKTMQEQAVVLGLAIDLVKNKYIMRFELK